MYCPQILPSSFSAFILLFNKILLEHLLWRPASTAGAVCLIPGWETTCHTPCMVWPKREKKARKKKKKGRKKRVWCSGYYCCTKSYPQTKQGSSLQFSNCGRKRPKSLPHHELQVTLETGCKTCKSLFQNTNSKKTKKNNPP